MKEHENLKKIKSQWNTPTLTVLVRNNPEENVLTACKMRANGGPNNNAAGCTVLEQEVICNYCAIQGNS